MEYLFKKEEDLSPENKREKDAARQFKYEMQDYDHIIVDYLKDGRCDEDRLHFLLEEANANERQGQINFKFQEMWTPYRRSFKADIPEVLGKFTNFLDEHAANLALSQLLELFKLTDALGARSKRKIWLDCWISHRIPKSNLKELRELVKHCQSSKLKGKIKKREKELCRTISIQKLITGVVDHSGWNPEIVRQLGSCEVADFRREFLKVDTENFLPAIHQFCESWRKSSEAEKAVEAKVEKALLSIAKINKLQAMRVRLIIPWAFPHKTVESTDIVESDLTE